jgi:hypothetical protein
MSMACEAPWLAGWVMREEYLLSWPGLADDDVEEVVIDRHCRWVVRSGKLKAGRFPCLFKGIPEARLNDSESFQIDFAGRVRLLKAYEGYTADVGMLPELYQLADELRKQHQKSPEDPSLLCVCEDILEYHEMMEGEAGHPPEIWAWNLYQRHRLILHSDVMLHRKIHRRWTIQNALALLALLVYGGVVALIFVQEASRWWLLPPTLAIALLTIFWEELMPRLRLSPVRSKAGECEPFENRAQLNEVRRRTLDFDKQPYPFRSHLNKGSTLVWLYGYMAFPYLVLIYAVICPLVLIGRVLNPEKQKKVVLVWP